MSSLQGAPQLRARLKAIRTVFKPMGQTWTVEATRRARSYAPRRTGALAASIKPKNVTLRKATIFGKWYSTFVKFGSREHDITATGKTLKFDVQGGTIFRKKVHKRAIRPNNAWATRAAQEARDKISGLADLIKLWNSAA